MYDLNAAYNILYRKTYNRYVGTTYPIEIFKLQKYNSKSYVFYADIVYQNYIHYTYILNLSITINVAPLILKIMLTI